MAEPAWKSLKGTRRVQAEFKHLSKAVNAGKLTFIKNLELVGDNLMCWRFGLFNFDGDLPGGAQLNADLAQLKRRFGQDHLLMEVRFPSDYPTQPFFIRVVKPRCVMYTGHVTAGGSICLEALTTSGTPGSWRPELCVEALLNVVMVNMIDCETTVVQTATGPGGRSGPLRVDFSTGNPMAGYSSSEAKAAFQRTLDNHRRMGWGGTAGAAAGFGLVLGGGAGTAGMLAGMLGSFNAGPAAAAAAAAAAARFKRPAPAPAAVSPRKRHRAAAPPAAGGGAGLAGVPARSSVTPQAPLIDLADSDSDTQQQQQQQQQRRRKPLPSLPWQQQQQQQQRPPVLVVDSDEEGEVRGPAAGRASRQGSSSPAAGTQPPASAAAAAAAAAIKRLAGPSNPAAAAAAAAAAAGAGGAVDAQQRQRPRRRLDTRQQQQQQKPASPDVIVISSQPDDDEADVLLLGAAAPTPTPAAAAAASGRRRRTQQAAAAAAAAADDVVLTGVVAPRAPPPPPAPPQLQLQLSFPPYWDFRGMKLDSVRLVELPLPGQQPPPPPSPLQAAADAAGIDPQLTAALQQQGLGRDDALAALLLAQGDADEALLRAATCAECGGAARAWLDMQGPAARAAVAAAAAEAAAQQQASSPLLEEADRVLGMFEEGGMARDRVVRIQRLQHGKLWRRYVLRRQDVEDERGATGVNEELLFHGSNASVIDTICSTGFDFRLVNYSSAYGNGTYFADHSTTAFAYCNKPDTAGRVPGGAGFGAPFAPPPAMLALAQRTAGGKRGSRVQRQQQQWQTAAAAAAASAAVPGGGGCPPGCFKMLLARVVLGAQGAGQPGLRVPPANCDSVNSGATPVLTPLPPPRAGGGGGVQQAKYFARPRQYFCHVIFDNDQAYPEYVITFK